VSAEPEAGYDCSLFSAGRSRDRSDSRAVAADGHDAYQGDTRSVGTRRTTPSQ